MTQSSSGNNNPHPLDEAIIGIRAKSAELFSVTVDEMLGKRRSEHVRFARTALFNVLRDQTQLSLPAIGRLLGRDHTTVISALQRHESLSKNNETYTNGYDTLKQYVITKFGAAIADYEDELRRSSRSRDEFPDPAKPRDASVNRHDALFSARVEKTILEAVEEFRKKSGMTKKAITEAALLEFIQKNDPDSGPA